MAFSIIFGQAVGTEPMNYLDTMFALVGANGVTRCTCTGTNALALTPNANQAPVLAYSSMQFFAFIAQNTNTAQVSVSVNGLGFIQLFNPNGTQLTAGAITGGAVILISADGNGHAWLIAGGSSNQFPDSTYAVYQSAALEPAAIEGPQYGTFVYAVTSSAPKMLMASFYTAISGAGRMEVRNPQGWMPLTATTLSGMGGGTSKATAIIINPALATYTNPSATHYNRLAQIQTLTTQTVTVSATGQDTPFLPGAYGAIITQVTCFDFAWIAMRLGSNSGYNLSNEINDNSTQRVGNVLSLPVSKASAGSIESATGGSGGNFGSVSYVLVPSTWSAVPDPVSSTYIFRDDFMESSLSGTTWTITNSTAGNFSINTTYQWCQAFANGTWGANGMFATQSYTRTSGRNLVIDVFVAGTTTGLIVGWNNGGGQSFSNMVNAVNFNAGNLEIFEGGAKISTSGTYSGNSIYRFQITLQSSGAIYRVQGGVEYSGIGGTTWTNLTPTSSSSTTTPVFAAIASFSGLPYVSDVRIY
jgi:hypothetical protein